MKILVKLFAVLVIVFMGLGSFASFLNPTEITEVRASHILVKTRPEAVKLKKEIEHGDITFEEAAMQYSLCPSGQRGGDLGFFNRKQMVQQFADTAFDQKIGVISNPVGTQFGWHLIKTTAKR
jgi:peptidyl-prolyl cis-trans isomerase C